MQIRTKFLQSSVIVCMSNLQQGFQKLFHVIFIQFKYFRNHLHHSSFQKLSNKIQVTLCLKLSRCFQSSKPHILVFNENHRKIPPQHQIGKILIVPVVKLEVRIH